MHFKFFYPVRIKMTHKSSKVVAARNWFSSAHVIEDATCFGEFFSLNVITGSHHFFIKVCHGFKIFFNHHIAAFFETSALKEVRILRCVIHNGLFQCRCQRTKFPFVP